jgi:hypothetical protein
MKRNRDLVPVWVLLFGTALVTAILLLNAGCSIGQPRWAKAATTEDVKESENRIKEQINGWNDRQAKQWEKISNHDSRLVSLERDVWWLIGAGGLAGVGGGMIGKTIKNRRASK